MPASEAHVRTDRAGRYLAQLCDHGSKMSRKTSHRPRPHIGGGTPPDVRHVETSGTHGIITFGGGRCTLHATDEALILTAEAEDPQNLQRMQEGIARRLARIGRRDRLKVTWQQHLTEETASECTDEPD